MLRTLHCNLRFNKPLSLQWKASFNRYEKHPLKLALENYKTLCRQQSSLDFDRCFVTHTKKENNKVYLTYVGLCTLPNVNWWFVYQIGSGKNIVFWLVKFFLLQLWFAKTCENDRTCPMTEPYLHHWSYMSAWVIFFRKTGKLLFLIISFPWTMFPCSPEGFLIPFIPFVPLRKNATSHYETVPFQNRPFLFNWNLINQKTLTYGFINFRITNGAAK